MSKMIETNVDPKLMISKLKNVKEKVEEMGTECSLDREIWEPSLENLNQVIYELDVLQNDIEER